MATALVLMVIKPSLAFYSTPLISHAFRGLMTTKNGGAAEASFGIIMEGILLKIFLDEHSHIPQWYVPLFLIQWVFLVLCRATGALLTTVFCLVYIFLFTKHRFPVGWIYCIVNVAWVVMALSILPMLAPLLESLGKDATLTGRTPLWQQVVKVMSSHKTLTGFGYCRFWVEPKDYTLVQSGFGKDDFFGQVAVGAHNMLLELWLNVGLIGIALFFIAILFATRRIREVPEGSYMFISSFVVFLLVGGLTERIFDNYQYKTLMFFVTLGLGCKRPRPEARLFSWQKEKQTQFTEGAVKA